jgi:hypothetical protein
MSDLMTRGVIMMPLELAMSSELSRMQFHSRAQDLLVERDTYRDLCAELLNSIKPLKSFYSYDDQLNKRFTIEEVIAKAERLLGENNAT